MQATLRATRVHLGLSIEEGAKKIGISVPALRSYEEFKSVPLIGTIASIIDAYELNSIDDLSFFSKQKEFELEKKISKCSSKVVK